MSECQNTLELSHEEASKAIRKYRKKLREIEQLESSSNKLTRPEKFKISRKKEIRSQLQEVLTYRRKIRVEYLRDDNFRDFSHSTENIEDASNDTPRIHFNQEVIADVTPILPKKSVPKPGLDTGDVLSNLSIDPPKESFQSPCKQKQKTSKSYTFTVTPLEGHNGNICSVDISNQWLVSGSRDTSVKLWDLKTCEELRNLSGHNEAVTCVKIINKTESDRIRDHITFDSNELAFNITSESNENDLLLLTGSTDCSVKVWLLPHGTLIKSIYTFSPVMVLLHCQDVVFAGLSNTDITFSMARKRCQAGPSAHIMCSCGYDVHTYYISGSDIGKLTAFDIVSGHQLCDAMIHDDKISSLNWENGLLMSTGHDQNLKLWEFFQSDSAVTCFNNISDELKPKLKFSLLHDSDFERRRPILNACFYKGKVIFGDDGINIKSLNITTGVVNKYPNHAEVCGFTDSFCVFDDCLMSTSFNLDNGVGSLNVRFPVDGSLNYVTSLSHSTLPRLLCSTVDQLSNSNYLVTGGPKLLLWKKCISSFNKNEDNNAFRVRGKTLVTLSREATSSGVDSDVSDDDDDKVTSWWWLKQEKRGRARKRPRTESTASESSRGSSSISRDDIKSSNWWWWCTLF